MAKEDKKFYAKETEDCCSVFPSYALHFFIPQRVPKLSPAVLLPLTLYSFF